MKKILATAIVLVCGLQSAVAVAADAAVCLDVGSGQSSISARPSTFTLVGQVMYQEAISLMVFPLNGKSCFGQNIGYKSTRGGISIIYATMGTCGTNSIPSQLSLNATQGQPKRNKALSRIGASRWFDGIYRAHLCDLAHPDISI